MTLTEQWKKGELPDGLYYCKLACFNYEPTVAKCKSGCIGLASFSKNEEVLAPVPSYKEYSRLEWYAGCGPDRIVELNKENRQLRKWCEEFNTLDVAKENKQLKELLKECKEHLCHHYCQITVGKLEKKIEEVLK